MATKADLARENESLKTRLATLEAAMKTADRSIIKADGRDMVSVPLTNQEWESVRDTIEELISSQSVEYGDNLKSVVEPWRTSIHPVYDFFFVRYSHDRENGTIIEKAWGLVPVAAAVLGA